MDQRNEQFENIPLNIQNLVGQIEALKGQWIGGAKLNPQALGRLKRSVLVTSTGASTRIEGSRLSDLDVEKLMRGLTVQKFTDRDTQEVRGYFELLENVFQAWKRIPFSEGTIKHLQKELLKHAVKDVRHRGDYKKQENSVEMIDASGKSLGVIFKTIPAYLTPKHMQELVEWTQNAFEKKTVHPLLVIGLFLVEFLAIHPFQDGNGRLSRVLTNLLMLKYGYEYVQYVSHEKLVEERKANYYIALRRSQAGIEGTSWDIMPWLEFFLGVVLEQSRQAIEILSHENLERLLSPKQLAVWRHLEAGVETTPGAIAKATGVARATVSQAIDVLLRLKKIERIGQGRTTQYRKLFSNEKSS